MPKLFKNYFFTWGLKLSDRKEAMYFIDIPMDVILHYHTIKEEI